MQTAFRYGLYAALVQMAIALITYATGLTAVDTPRWVGTVTMIFSIAISTGAIYLAQKERIETEFGGIMTYGQGLGTAMLVGLASGVVGAIFMFIYTSYINPEFVENIRTTAEAQMNANKAMTTDEREQ